MEESWNHTNLMHHKKTIPEIHLYGKPSKSREKAIKTTTI